MFLYESKDQRLYRLFAKVRLIVTPPDDLATEQPDMVAVPGQRLVGKLLAQKIQQKGFECFDNALANDDIVCFDLPG